jgi:hypothetical protein
VTKVEVFGLPAIIRALIEPRVKKHDQAGKFEGLAVYSLP